jgi:hypothetical protein
MMKVGDIVIIGAPAPYVEGRTEQLVGELGEVVEVGGMDGSNRPIVYVNVSAADVPWAWHPGVTRLFWYPKQLKVVGSVYE